MSFYSIMPVDSTLIDVDVLEIDLVGSLWTQALKTKRNSIFPICHVKIIQGHLPRQCWCLKQKMKILNDPHRVTISFSYSTTLKRNNFYCNIFIYKRSYRDVKNPIKKMTILTKLMFLFVSWKRKKSTVAGSNNYSQDFEFLSVSLCAGDFEIFKLPHSH